MIKISSLAMPRLALTVSCLLVFVLQGHTLLRPMLITDDIAQHHVWLDAGEGSGFQPNDPWLVSAKAIQPYVAAAVFEAVRLFLPTLLVGKVIALVMMALTGFLMYRIGECLGGVRLGWITLGLFFVSDAWIGFSGGFARSFAWPLVSAFLLGQLTGRRGLTALSLFLAAALYPIAFVLLSPAYVLIWLHRQMGEGWRNTWNLPVQWRTHWPVILAAVAGCTLVLLKSRELSYHPLVGPQVTLDQIQHDPLYGPGGRVPLWPQTALSVMLPWTLIPWDKALLEPVLRHVAALPAVLSKGASAMFPLSAVFGGVLALFIVGRRRCGAAVVLLALAISGVLTFWLAELLLPRLFESSRYLVWSMPVLGVLAWAVLFDAAVGCLRPGRVRQVALILLVLVLAARAPAMRGKGAEDVSEYAALYMQLARTGGGEMIACFPRTGDLISVLCHRSVFISHESSHAVLFTRYRELVMERQSAQLKAFYSKKSEDVRSFCGQNNISWLVVEEKYYRQDMEPGVHFAPFELQMREMLKQTPEPWLLTYARKFGKQVQSGVYLLNTGSIIASSDLP
jgi:hypothetical protein